MNTKTHTNTPSEAVLLAYGQEVAELLSSSDVPCWTAELWTMFSGYIIALEELGPAQELHKTYFCFKELLEFFVKLEQIRLRKI